MAGREQQQMENMQPFINLYQPFNGQQQQQQPTINPWLIRQQVASNFPNPNMNGLALPLLHNIRPNFPLEDVINPQTMSQLTQFQAQQHFFNRIPHVERQHEFVDRPRGRKNGNQDQNWNYFKHQKYKNYKKRFHYNDRRPNWRRERVENQIEFFGDAEMNNVTRGMYSEMINPYIKLEPLYVDKELENSGLNAADVANNTIDGNLMEKRVEVEENTNNGMFKQEITSNEADTTIGNDVNNNENVEEEVVTTVEDSKSCDDNDEKEVGDVRLEDEKGMNMLTMAKTGFKRVRLMENSIQITVQHGKRVVKDTGKKKVKTENFFCDVCSTLCSSKKDLDDHNASENHVNNVNVLEAETAKKSRVLMSKLVVTTEIDSTASSAQEKPKAAGLKKKFCKRCNEWIIGNGFDHKKSLEHKKKKIANRPFCQACCQHLHSPKHFIDHMKTKRHQENHQKMLQETQLKIQQNALEEATGSQLNVEENSTRQIDENSSKDSKQTQVQMVENSTQSQQTHCDSSMDVIEVVQTAPIIKHEECDSFNPDEKWNGNVEVGKQLLVPLAGIYCKACNKYYKDKHRAEGHCRSKSHFENYKAFMLKKRTNI